MFEGGTQSQALQGQEPTVQATAPFKGAFFLPDDLVPQGTSLYLPPSSDFFQVLFASLKLFTIDVRKVGSVQLLQSMGTFHSPSLTSYPHLNFWAGVGRLKRDKVLREDKAQPQSSPQFLALYQKPMAHSHSPGHTFPGSVLKHIFLLIPRHS